MGMLKHKVYTGLGIIPWHIL